MNNRTSINYLILILTAIFCSCSGTGTKETKNNTAISTLSLHEGDEKYIPINTKESVVTWKGSMLVGTNSHTGFIYLSKGELMIENDKLMGGTVEVDMSTIEDNNHGRNNNLVNHLKDPDFFDVKKFPFSSIVITKVETTNGELKNVTGNLTIKNITNQVTFPAKITIKNGVVNANGKLVIDRTKWDVRYKSGKFYDLLANQTMSDSIEFHINILAKK